MNVTFSYGTELNRVDVTAIAQRAFVNLNRLVVPQHTSFNDLFTDVMPNVRKTLKVQFCNDEATLVLRESRTKDYILSTSGISEKGYWIGEDVVCEHAFDGKLCQALITFFRTKGGTVCDLGCGMGEYTRKMREAGISADGFDGNPNTPQLTNGLANVLDLSVPVNFPKKYDWVLSLEVGEHLPPEYERIFINNVVNNNCKGIILSWAVEGQGGYGHFNCRNNDYVKQQIMDCGYDNDIETEKWLRDNVELSWFKNTIMVFIKREQ